MNHSDSQIMSIFADALACDSPKLRVEHLDRACGEDAILRVRIEALLNAHYEAGDFLKGRESPGDFVSVTDDANVETSGTIIGPYKLLEQIGEGGMGVVYMADQQTPVVRRVALKIIKPGMDTRKVIARFEAERQALALMEHPHIAKVFDAGTTASTDRGHPGRLSLHVDGLGALVPPGDGPRYRGQNSYSAFDEAAHVAPPWLP